MNEATCSGFHLGVDLNLYKLNIIIIILYIPNRQKYMVLSNVVNKPFLFIVITKLYLID